MNPEEGRLRPQIMDRFGLRLVVAGLKDEAQRLEVYRRVRAYLTNPRATVADYADQTLAARAEIQSARNLLPSVRLTPEAEQTGLALIHALQLDSLRTEITLFEAARAYAAADSRAEATPADVRAVAPMTVRLRRSQFMVDYFHSQQAEETEIQSKLDNLIPPAVPSP
jgi:magnesium chelatase subunit I